MLLVKALVRRMAKAAIPAREGSRDLVYVAAHAHIRGVWGHCVFFLFFFGERDDRCRKSDGAFFERNERHTTSKSKDGLF